MAAPPQTKPNLPHIPRLPVPELRSTLDKYLASLEPLLLENEKRGGISYQSSHSLRRKWADEFEVGIGKVFQDRLVALDRESPNNWLDDNFWINKAYLEQRAPLLVNSNWWVAYVEDDAVPATALKGETNNKRAGTTLWQLRRAAWLIWRALEFKDKLDTQELHPDTTKTGIWIRDSTSKMLNTARIPEPFCDKLSTPPETPTREARSILVMLHDWCYAVPVYYPPTSPNSRPILMSPKQIEARLSSLVLDVEDRLARGEKPIPVGTLIADHRDKWASNLDHLLALHPSNRKSHHAMLNSIMALSLDHTTFSITPPHPSHLLPPHMVHHRSSAQSALDSHLHMMRGNELNIGNRFYDKPCTLVVDPSTRAGACGEHSPCDSVVQCIFAEYSLAQGIELSEFTDDKAMHPQGVNASEPSWERLDWVADEHIQKECTAARGRALKIVENSDYSVLWFGDYGTDWIKSIGNLSPDGYVQMVLQLVWYKTRGEFTATYESVLTRMFKKGRTETVRTLTRDARDWVLSMVTPGVSNRARLKALQRAVQTHTRLTREAATGRGIDRHLLGLQLLSQPANGESAELFGDELFGSSSEWKLSTSGLGARDCFKGTGFGALYEDGYGISYLAAPDMIKFGIESKFSSANTSTEKFKKVAVECLMEMKLLCLENEGLEPRTATSHL
ncbi:hypothetical protein EST38_g4610 [Candolleomyces aberdarensis]|uniref:Choline/carnitine acyltransferase domain-containing protein n=1 Tax=Candolleomyces aberdarensis TaxID=2316362 RepID=A0A4Q2DP99_9AGAR|nr:hypothetical protein EST38_g4610 [Candolleomyces aberdarensis]